MQTSFQNLTGSRGLSDQGDTRKRTTSTFSGITADPPDVVTGEQAPSALPAARSFGILVVALGTTCTLAPTTLPIFPILLDEYRERNMVGPKAT